VAHPAGLPCAAKPSEWGSARVAELVRHGEAKVYPWRPRLRGMAERRFAAAGLPSAAQPSEWGSARVAELVRHGEAKVCRRQPAQRGTA